MSTQIVKHERAKQTIRNERSKKAKEKRQDLEYKMLFNQFIGLSKLLMRSTDQLKSLGIDFQPTNSKELYLLLIADALAYYGRSYSDNELEQWPYNPDSKEPIEVPWWLKTNYKQSKASSPQQQDLSPGEGAFGQDDPIVEASK